MSTLVPPHGGKLVNLLVEETELAERLKQARQLHYVSMSSLETSDVIMLATGAFSPLQGFMCEGDYQHVINEMRLSNGLLWPLPVTLSVDIEAAKGIKEGSDIALIDSESGKVIGIMTVEQKYRYDKRLEAQLSFGTTDENHPGVKKLYEKGDIYLGGPIMVFDEGNYVDNFPEYGRPADTRQIFSQKGWHTIAAFQTRNPMHRSHEYLTKVALEICDGLFIHPIVGQLKDGDIPADVRIKCYRVLLEKYYPDKRVVLKVYPMEMRYAGPKEAILHAIIRQNYGCSHLIVGRDHAGVGNYYGPFDAQQIFDDLNDDDLCIKPLKLDISFWCSKCKSMASYKTCPHDDSDRLNISGTKLRQMLAAGQRPPDEFSRSEVVDILMDYYRGEDI